MPTSYIFNPLDETLKLDNGFKYLCRNDKPPKIQLTSEHPTYYNYTMGNIHINNNYPNYSLLQKERN